MNLRAIKILFLCSQILLINIDSLSQELKNREVRDAVERGLINDLRIIAADSFAPGTNVKFDIALNIKGKTALASQYNNIIWDKINLSFIGGNKTSNRDLIQTFNANYYYPVRPLTITASFAGFEVKKELQPEFCTPNFNFTLYGKTGIYGEIGKFTLFTPGTDGGDGSDGGDGQDGPDMYIQVEETILNGKEMILFIIESNHFKSGIDSLIVQPNCGTIVIASKGGSGGNGGDGAAGTNGARQDKQFVGYGGSGGNGGNGGFGGQGGNLYVSGGALNKYRNLIRFESLGGDGGSAGSGGRGGEGISRGKPGRAGKHGSTGRRGFVEFVD